MTANVSRAAVRMNSPSDLHFVPLPFPSHLVPFTYASFSTPILPAVRSSAPKAITNPSLCSRKNELTFVSRLFSTTQLTTGSHSSRYRPTPTCLHLRPPPTLPQGWLRSPYFLALDLTPTQCLSRLRKLSQRNPKCGRRTVLQG